ncbi:protein phosphatase 2C domain-containing protein [Streptomyces sp. NPDC048258]|uniref:protein phosphatase 2C domain-containing protein n=1 Tax=Streptomyces sp. NPDC048258 TaxID=3365527 RepID=UPI00371AFC44
MSQQGAGADDWWQKLYEDPDAVPEADPGDTLDNRFRSASVLTTDPGPGSVPAPPGREPVPERPPAPPPAAPAPPAGEPLLPGPRRSPPPPPPGWPPAPPPAPPLESAAPPPPQPSLPDGPAHAAPPSPAPPWDSAPAQAPSQSTAPPGESGVPAPQQPPLPAGPAHAAPPPSPAPPWDSAQAQAPSQSTVPPGESGVPAPQQPPLPAGPAHAAPPKSPAPPPSLAPPWDSAPSQSTVPPVESGVPAPPQPPLPGTDQAPGQDAGLPVRPSHAAPPVGAWSAAGPSPAVPPPGEFAPAEPAEAPLPPPEGPAQAPLQVPPPRTVPEAGPPQAAPQGPGPAPDPGADRPGPGLLPGPRSAAEQQAVLPPVPPRDPRAGGVTGYVLGDVDVPPVQPPGLPARRRDVPQPGPAPAAEPAEPDRRAEVRHLGDRAPTYAAEPGALPPADPAALDGLTADTVLEGARYGTYTLRAASLRGDSARFRGEARRDFLLTARFGGGDDALVLVALAGGDRSAPGAAEAAAELCRTIAAAVGRSQERLGDDIRAGRRDALRSGLQRLTDRGYGRLRARAAELGLAEEAYTAGVRGLLLPVDPECRTRVCFGAGAGGLFRLRAGAWQDLEPAAGTVRPPETAEAAEPADGGFRFRASVARPGDTLLLCSGGLAEPMREEAVLAAELAARWADPEPPGLAAFLADTQLRLKGYADDRTAAAVWEA